MGDLKGSNNAELYTPEALRAASRSSQDDRAPTKPGEQSPKKTPSSKSSSKVPGRLRRCGAALAFVPWWALVALGLLVAGLTLVAIKGTAAADAATTLSQQLSSNTNKGFPKYMDVYSTSVWVMVGIAGAGVAALVLGAMVRLDQKLRKAGKYSTAKGPYGPWLYRFYCFFDWVGLILVTLLALWAALAGVMLASWAAQCWNLEKGATVASANMAAFRALATSYNQSLDNFGSTLMASAGSPAPANTQGTAAQATNSSANATTSGSAGVSSTISSGILSLKQLSRNFSDVSNGSPVWQDSKGLCPSAACLSLALYPFTESTACACTTKDISTTATLAGEAKDTAVWAAIGVAAIFAGAVFAALELAADCVLLSADQLFLRVIKRKSSRSSSRGSARKGEDLGMGKMVTSPSMPRGGSYPYLTVNATAQT